MKKIFFLFFILLIGCEKEDNSYLEFFDQKVDVDLRNWSYEIVKVDINEEGDCKKYNILYNISLKNDCFENSDLVSDIKRIFFNGEMNIYKKGRCWTYENIKDEVEIYKNELSKHINNNICVKKDFIGNCAISEFIDSKEVESRVIYFENNLINAQKNKKKYQKGYTIYNLKQSLNICFNKNLKKFELAP